MSLKGRYIPAVAVLTVAILAGCAATIAPTPASDNPDAPHIALRFLGEQRLSHRLEFGATIVGGLSGIDYDAETDTFYVISDDRSAFSPARFYTARLEISEHGFSNLSLLRVVALLRKDGTPYAPRPAPDVPDPEAIRFDPGTRTLWWTSEGERGISHSRFIDPFIRQAGLDGRYLGEVPLPAMFRMRSDAYGPRDNLVFEGATLSTDIASLWVAMEAPLLQDGAMPTTTAGALTRISRFDRDAAGSFGAFIAQYAYPVDPAPHGAIVPIVAALNGVTEMLALTPSRFLVLERAYAVGFGFRAKLFESSIDGATDIKDTAALAQTPAIKPMKKRLVLDFATLGIAIDNLEGVCFGPTLANGHRTLVFVSDDNFNPGQITQFLAFEVVE